MKRRTASAVSLVLLGAVALASASDWPNWRGPMRTGVSDETGLVSTWSQVRREPDLEGRPVGPRHAGGVRRAGLHQRALRRGSDPPRDGGLLRRGHRQEALAARLQRLQHDGAVLARGLGLARRRPGDGLRLHPERGRRHRVPRQGGQDGLAAPARRGVRTGLGLRRPHPRPPGGRGPRGRTGIVGSGWGDIGPPRQRYMAFDKRTGGVRWISTPAQGPFDDANNQASPTVGVIGGRRLVIGGWRRRLALRARLPLRARPCGAST